MATRLLERKAERRAITGALQHVARSDAGTTLVLRGEPGLGKTRLLRTAAQEADDRFTVVQVSGHEMEQAYPFAVVHQILESLLRTAGSLAKDLADTPESLRLLLNTSVQSGAAGDSPSSAPARFSLLHSLYWLLASLAEQRPLLLCVDDLHWSDPDSLEAIRFLAWRLQKIPIALFAGLRPWPPPAGELAMRLHEGGKAELLDLQPLSVQGTATVLQFASGEMPDAGRVAKVHALTRGNPLLLEQLGRILQSGGALPEEEEHGADAIPGSSVILARLSGLPPDSLKFLRAASVLGVECRPDVAMGIAGIDPNAVSLVLSPTHSLGLYTVRQDGLGAFVHPMVRRALYDGLELAEREELHMRAAGLLQARGASAAEVAPHLARAAEPGDLEAIRVLRRAAADAWAVAAYDSAAVHLQHAARISTAGEGRASVLHELGRAFQRAGSHRRAIASFEAAASEACPSELLGRIHQSWGLSLTLMGDVSAAIGQFDEAIAATAVSDPGFAAASAAARTVLEVTINAGTAVRSGLEARRLAEASGDPDAMAKAWAAWAHAAILLGDQRMTWRVALEGVPPISDSAPDEIEHLWGWCPRIQFGMIDMRTERYEHAAAVMKSQREQAEAVHNVAARIWATTFLVETEWRRGRLHDAYRLCGHSAAYPDDIPWATAQAHTVHGYVLMEMGDLDGAEACFDHAEDHGRRAGFGGVQRICAWGRATLAARRGAMDVASDTFQLMLATTGQMHLFALDFFHCGREAAEIFVLTGRFAEARRVIRAMLQEAPASESPGFRAAVLRCRGLLEARQGHDQLAERTMLAALALHAKSDEMVERGRTLLAYGALLRRMGEHKRSRALLAEAVDAFEPAGSTYWLHIAQTERRSAGGRRRSSAGDGYLGLLTPQEYRIVDLVALGLTNRQIAYQLVISPKTLETHLRHVYDKLEASSREELKAMHLQRALHSVPGIGRGAPDPRD